MNCFTRNHKGLVVCGVFLALVAVLIGLSEAWPATAPVRGRMAARRDVRRGHYQLLVYGLPPAGRPEYERLLRERYHIQTEAAAYCIVSRPLRSYVDAYDEVSIAAADRKYGHDVFKEWLQISRVRCLRHF